MPSVAGKNPNQNPQTLKASSRSNPQSLKTLNARKPETLDSEPSQSPRSWSAGSGTAAGHSLRGNRLPFRALQVKALGFMACRFVDVCIGFRVQGF